MNNRLYPEPPHLSVAAYPRDAPENCFMHLCSTVKDSGGVPQWVVEVAPWDAEFEQRSDLADTAAVLEVDPNRFSTLVDVPSDRGRVLRAGYSAKGIGDVLVEYQPAVAPDQHPIAITMAAGPLSMPRGLWDTSDRSHAKKLVRWVVNLLEMATGRCHCPYASIDVERSLPTPSELRSGTAELGSDFFLARGIADNDEKLRKALESGFAGTEKTTWPHGYFYSTSSLFNPGAQQEPGPQDTRRYTECSSALGRALHHVNTD